MGCARAPCSDISHHNEQFLGLSSFMVFLKKCLTVKDWIYHFRKETQFKFSWKLNFYHIGKKTLSVPGESRKILWHLPQFVDFAREDMINTVSKPSAKKWSGTINDFFFPHVYTAKNLKGSHFANGLGLYEIFLMKICPCFTKKEQIRYLQSVLILLCMMKGNIQDDQEKCGLYVNLQVM